MNKLIGQFDAKVWAVEFIAMVRKKPKIALDEGTMIAWFANAIMTGYDKAKNDARPSVAGKPCHRFEVILGTEEGAEVKEETILGALMTKLPAIFTKMSVERIGKHTQL